MRQVLTSARSETKMPQRIIRASRRDDLSPGTLLSKLLHFRVCARAAQRVVPPSVCGASGRGHVAMCLRAPIAPLLSGYTSSVFRRTVTAECKLPVVHRARARQHSSPTGSFPGRSARITCFLGENNSGARVPLDRPRAKCHSVPRLRLYARLRAELKPLARAAAPAGARGRQRTRAAPATTERARAGECSGLQNETEGNFHRN